MSIDPGRVCIHLSPERRALVACERPKLAPLLLGRPVDDVLALLPLLFAVCAQAQRLAAGLAVAAARGEPCAPRIDLASAREAAREHAWRLLLDWPQELDLAPEREHFLRVQERIRHGAADDFPCPGWLDQVDDTPDQVPRLPCLNAIESLSVWPSLDEAFARQPVWQGVSAETGVTPTTPGEPSSARARLRWRARELADHLAGRSTRLGGASAVRVRAGRGRALVQTARGLLMHEVQLDGERIADYVIVAPTDWNFCATGPVAHAIETAIPRDPAAARRRMRHLVAALDPCVPWQVWVD